MASIDDLKQKYLNLDREHEISDAGQINPNLLMAFDYDYEETGAEISIDTEEFTAVCPWTDLPDFGTLTIKYVPNSLCVELKSLKYYLLSYVGVGIVQEHAANKILQDLVKICKPKQMMVWLDYKVRGGLHTSVSLSYPLA
jgi:7-cyano-7-deazaguanine reductase